MNLTRFLRHGRPRMLLRLVALLTVLAIQACGGGGGGEATSATGLPDQTGCTYQYSLTMAPELTGEDPLLSLQWHLNNAGQTGGAAGEDLRVLAAWPMTRGAGARVAVIDDAIEVLHEDLVRNVVPGASYSYRPQVRGSPYPLPCGLGQEHGTSVAGIIAARDGNAIGGAGVAPRASLVAYGALATGYDADIADALTRGLAENGVYHNSWGAPDDGRLNFEDAAYGSAINEGIANGRAGKGAVYVFAGGNGGCYATDGSGRCFHETTGLDGYLNHLGVIAVCGVDDRGRKPDYAEPGANLLVCGATGRAGQALAITTTTAGNGYRREFTGASASAPMVSGVVALMLSANPALTWRDVRLILAQTARRNDPGDAGWSGSAFAPAFNHKYGFGVADAQAAVTAARTWVSVGGSDAMRSCGPYARNPGIALPDAMDATLTTREDRIEVGQDCGISRIEYVEIGFTANHAYSGDLRIRLTSPNGLGSELVDERLCDGSGDACGSYSDWRFGSVRHLGEPAAGQWRLEVTDAQPGDTGTWERWSLRIWGR